MRIRRLAPVALLLALAATTGACSSSSSAPPPPQPVSGAAAAPSSTGPTGATGESAAPVRYGIPADLPGLCSVLPYGLFASVLGSPAGPPQADEKLGEPHGGRTASCGQKLRVGAESGPGGAVRTYLTLWSDEVTAAQQFAAIREADARDYGKDGRRYIPQNGVGNEGYRIVGTMSGDSIAVQEVTVRHGNLRISVRVLADRGHTWDAATTANLVDRMAAFAGEALPAIQQVAPAG
ncbi:hypothetical protein [Kitasatospora sp. NPDC051914]|uniref:hypothetical protein n=1 Tax=Kitasatospora sp. NPDC051914 TaxID=3154945 RepID=UPI003441ABB5